jgi:hypothetical protein
LFYLLYVIKVIFPNSFVLQIIQTGDSPECDHDPKSGQSVNDHLERQAKTAGNTSDDHARRKKRRARLLQSSPREIRWRTNQRRGTAYSGLVVVSLVHASFSSVEFSSRRSLALTLAQRKILISFVSFCFHF